MNRKIKETLKHFIEHKKTSNFILFVIILNSALLGFMTDSSIMASFGKILHTSCNICVYIFTLELLIKLFVYKKNFFKDGWNNFDFIIVAISWIPTSGAFSSFRVFRILRALRALRLVTQLEKLRIIVQAIIASIPNVGWASVLLLVIFYIFSIMGTTLFAADFPDWFGSIGKSMYTLFQVMTLESWSMGISRPVMELHPYAWCYFVPFILVSSFIVMNVIVGVVVNAISEISDDIKQKKKEKYINDNKIQLEQELDKLKSQITLVEELIILEKNKNKEKEKQLIS